MRRQLLELLGAVLVAFGGAMVWAWYTTPAPIPPGVTVEATPAKEVRKEETIPVAIKASVKAYQPGVKSKLKLPATVVDNPGQHVISSSTTPNDERQHTLTTVIDVKTGETTTYDHTEPLPWLAKNTKTELGVYYGLRHGEQALRVEGRQELLQVKALHLGAIGSADITRNEVDSFVGVGVWARW